MSETITVDKGINGRGESIYVVMTSKGEGRAVDTIDRFDTREETRGWLIHAHNLPPFCADSMLDAV